MSFNKVVAGFSLTASALTLIGGILFVFEKLGNVNLRTKCDFFEPNCNSGWRKVFSLSPDDFISLWTPVILGFLAVGMHVQSLRVWVPASNLMLGFVMIFVGVFGAFGYMGLYGLLTGFCCVISGIVCIVAHFVGYRGPDVLSI
eukprot:TRINITY_DN26520_c0_g1_i1.p1 TRINITY_DN26520_c0_g1~~TRINITY_DN26520_c0_g1_i1.p1  ORF type:complete len:144 (-),score=13.82 TRINITY_DN26520_c0_g1_i1:332-763(-)